MRKKGASFWLCQFLLDFEVKMVFGVTLFHFVDRDGTWSHKQKTGEALEVHACKTSAMPSITHTIGQNRGLAFQQQTMNATRWLSLLLLGSEFIISFLA
jgi:hypothetical protein